MLTSFVKDDEKSGNFFKGLEYKNNFKIILDMLEQLGDIYENIEVTECFNAFKKRSKYIDYIKTFRYISFINFEGLSENVEKVLQEKEISYNLFIKKKELIILFDGEE
jgi:two-component sensor histidine kinase